MASLWQQRWQQWQTQRPRLHRDGISLPATLLLRTLRKQLDSDTVQVTHLALQPGESLLELTVQQPLTASLQLYFSFGEINWPARTLTIHYRLQGTPYDSSLIKRTLGTLLLATLDAGLGVKLLQRLAAELDFITIHPRHLTLHLDQLPLAARALEQDILGKPLARRLALTAISTSKDYLRLTLGRPTQG